MSGDAAAYHRTPPPVLPVPSVAEGSLPVLSAAEGSKGLWRRTLIGNPLFLWRVVKQRMGLLRFGVP